MRLKKNYVQNRTAIGKKEQMLEKKAIEVAMLRNSMRS
jgi:hypothetical protein